MDDRHLIRKIQNGRKEYLQEIAVKYYDDIYHFCCYQTGNTEDSHDLAQETFLRFIKYVENYRYRNLKGYLLTIAMNVCRDFHTVRKKADWYETHEEPEEWEQRADTSPGTAPEEAAVNADLARCLLNGLKQLPDMQREAIVLHYYYDMKFREIGRLSGVSTATAKSRVRQGMDKLKRILEHDGNEF